MAHKPAFHAYSAILDSFFCAYCAIVDSFVIASFFWETLHSAVVSLTNKLSLCLFKPMFWLRWLLFWVWSNRVPAATVYPYATVLIIPRSCAYLDSLGKFGFRVGLNMATKINVGLAPGLGFKMRPVYIQLCRGVPLATNFVTERLLAAKLLLNSSAEMLSLRLSASWMVLYSHTSFLWNKDAMPKQYSFSGNLQQTDR